MAAKGVVQPPEGQAWCTLRTRLRWAGRQAWACTAANPRKRWTELLWLAYSPFWITWCLVILVPFRLYERCNEAAYMVIGVATALPCVLLPWLLEPRSEAAKPLARRFWIKANLWIAILSFIGNYLWTHYFYQVLGAEYTFPSWQLNQVPVPLYLMTHAYFCFYHVLANYAIRWVRRKLEPSGAWAQGAGEAGVVFVLAYAMAFGETLSIASFPHYRFSIPRGTMYRVGSLFYGIYFLVSFPVFFRLDEGPAPWTLAQTVGSSLGACMLVTLLLDFWRLAFGSLAGGPAGAPPWLSA